MSSSPLRELRFDYFEGQPTVLKARKSGALTDQLMTSEIREINQGYTIRFSGKIVVPENGDYSFTTDPNAGTRLKIDDKIIFNHIDQNEQKGNITVPLLKEEYIVFTLNIRIAIAVTNWH